MFVTKPVTWILAGLALLSPGVAETQEREKGRRAREPIPSLVDLPDDFVRFVRVPEGGTSPRIAISQDGVLAVVYYRGDSSKGDLYLTRSTDDASTFSPSVRLNTQEGTVAAFRGEHAGSMAVDPQGRVYATWITAGVSPTVQFVREKPDGGFDVVQDLETPPALGESTAIAVASAGEVYVFYAARAPAGEDGGSAQDRIWMKKSTDGQRFGAPFPVRDEVTRVSKQSCIAARADSLRNTVFLFYRAGRSPGGENRSTCDMRLLASEDGGLSFVSSIVEQGGRSDPNSGANLSQGQNTTLAAWEGSGQVYWSVIRRSKNKIGTAYSPRPPDGPAWRSQAAVASSSQEVMLTWLQHPSKNSDELPDLRWQLWLREPLRFLAQGSVPQIPRGTNPVVFPRSERGFTVIY